MTDEIVIKEKTKTVDPLLEAQWDEWLATDPLKNIPDVDEVTLKEALIRDLSYASQMSVEEYTLFQKWCEIHEKYPTHEVSTLFGQETQLMFLEQAEEIQRVKDNVWFPESPDD